MPYKKLSEYRDDLYYVNFNDNKLALRCLFRYGLGTRTRKPSEQFVRS